MTVYTKMLITFKVTFVLQNKKTYTLQDKSDPYSVGLDKTEGGGCITGYYSCSYRSSRQVFTLQLPSHKYTHLVARSS